MSADIVDTFTSASSRGCRRGLWLAVGLALCTATSIAAQAVIPAHLPFADDGKTDPEFAAFRDGLLGLARRGAYAAVKKSIAPRVQVGEGEYGIAALERAWRIRQSPNAFLRELARVIDLGGRFHDDKTIFEAPYLWTDFPNAEESPSYVVVIARTPLLSSPRGTGATTAMLTDEVARHEPVKSREWLKVDLVDGRAGFVKASHVRQPNDYRATFRRIDGRWLLTEFQAGVH